MHARVKIALGTLVVLIAARLTARAFQPGPADKPAAPSAVALAAQVPASPCPASSLPDQGVCVPVPAGDADEPEATGAAGR